MAADSGGYREDFGFDAESNKPVPPVDAPAIPQAIQAIDEADDQQDGEQLSFNRWKTIACHAMEVAENVRAITRELGLGDELQDLLELAALWHDWGKSHPAFQGSIRGTDTIKRLDRLDLAKAPDECWPRGFQYKYLDDSETRSAFRHELASALGLFSILEIYAPRHDALLGPWVAVLEQMRQPLPEREPPPPATSLIERLLKCNAQQFDFVAYLVASHHGKVRVGLHAAPKDQDYRVKPGDNNGLPIRGIRDGDQLPSVELVPGEPPIPVVTLTLSPAAVGLSWRTGISWRERCIGLMERHGPAALAYLEAIMRAADVRASQLSTNDPALAAEGNA